MRSRLQACAAKNIHFAMRYCFAALIGALAARLSDGATRRAGWAAAAWRCCHWTEPKGGHFGAFEPPARLVDDLRAFFRPLR